jgi:hypothetical protein
VGWLPIANNTATAPTLNVNSLGGKTITKCGTTALAANDIVASVVAYADYDGTEFQLLNPQAVACAAASASVFSALTSGTNTSAAMVVGSGSSLGPSGTGTVNANQVNGGTVAPSAPALASNGSSQPIAATTTGTGSTVVLAAGPSLTGTTNIATLNLTNPLGATYGGTGADLHASTGLARAGNPFTAAEISGDASTSGSNALTLATVNSGPGTTNNANITTNGKGLVTANTAGTAHTIGVPSQCVGSGTGTAQTCTTSPTFVAAANDCVTFTSSLSNTGDMTLAVNGGSAFHIEKWQGSSTLVTGDLAGGVPLDLCLDANNLWELPTVGNPPASGATINNQNQYGAPYYSVSGSSNTLSGVAPPATQGYFNYDWVNTTSAATVPQPVQVGLGGHAITGAATTDTVLYSDVDGIVDHDVAGSNGVTETLPTPTTLNNTGFGFRYTNHSGNTDTISASGSFTIQMGTNAAASTLSVPSGAGCTFKLDPNSSTNWLADCGPNTGIGALVPATPTSPNGVPQRLTSTSTGGVAGAARWTPTAPLNAGPNGGFSGDACARIAAAQILSWNSNTGATVDDSSDISGSSKYRKIKISCSA